MIVQNVVILMPQLKSAKNGRFGYSLNERNVDMSRGTFIKLAERRMAQKHD
jgi:hypothetical protein